MIFRATMLLGARHARAMLMRGHTPTAPTRCLVPATTVCSAFGTLLLEQLLRLVGMPQPHRGIQVGIHHSAQGTQEGHL